MSKKNQPRKNAQRPTPQRSPRAEQNRAARQNSAARDSASQNSAPRNKQGSAPSEATILVRAPEGVRAAASLLLGLGVAAMVMPLATTWQVLVLVIAIGAGFLVTFSHPYRKKVRAAVESTGRKYKTSVAQIMPLFPLWLALMILPAFQIHSWIAALIVLALAGAYAWISFPSIDGTRYLAEPGTGQVRDDA
ncbi:hypothetical protein QP140_03295 [Corynebacterium sp. UMB9976]|uniref:hypothetical protein n=1 Tax=Corynebacterium sp. UMB9976 TaxID=3046354 RepID=UPI00254D9BEF|nr:hypothetical protein [Corynebacterium sp. UMB9976]MDK6301620.1 hypothetical protein [Corynebacterium sp. UMB9976]